MMSSNEALEALEEHLEKSIENIRQIGIIVSDFQPQGQSVLNQKIQTVIKDLQEIERLRHQVGDIQIPLEVFDYIDNGRNPQIFTKDCMEKAVSKNEEVKGKIEAYKFYKAKLLVELNSVFPKEINHYRALRGDERVSQPPNPQ